MPPPVEAETGQSKKFETYFSPMDKYFSISVFSPKKGKFATVFDNITERKKADETLKENEEKFRALVETTNTGYLILDSKGLVVDANDEYIRLTGHKDLKDIMGKSV